MKRVLALILVLLFVFSLAACAGNESETQDATKGVETLEGKTPKEIYDAAIAYVKGLTNYEVLVDGSYKSTYEGETAEDLSTSLYRCSGDSFYYLYKSGDYEEFFLHDGSALYKKVNNVSEKSEIAYADFMQSWGSITNDGMLIALNDTGFDGKLFLPDGDGYYLDFTISVDEYAEITGGTVEEPVSYRVYFDSNGVLTKFERSMIYYYYDVVLVEDNMKVYLQNVGEVSKIEAPQNPDSYAVRVSAEDIDLSSLESLDLFEATDKVTNYVLLNMKVEGSVKISDTETVENYEGKILIRLFEDVAPLSVSNFKKLVGTGFYNGLKIHRIVPDFVIQGGDPKGDGSGGSEEAIFGEFSSNGFTNNLSHKRGVVSMARSNDNNSATSQIFICHGDSTTLDGNYAAFGYVVYGLDTVDVIAGLETNDKDAPILKVTIETASFVNKKS